MNTIIKHICDCSHQAPLLQGHLEVLDLSRTPSRREEDPVTDHPRPEEATVYELELNPQVCSKEEVYGEVREKSQIGF